jgi:hypothetical protein
MKAGLEEIETSVDAFEEGLDLMDTMDLKALETVVERQDASNEDMNVYTIGALKDGYRDRHLA